MSPRSSETSRTIVISINASWNIVNFRKGLVAGLQAAGYRVVALAPADDYSAELAKLGIEHVPIEMDNQGVSPSRDLGLALRYYWALRRIRPDVFLGYTAKPNVYGSLAAHVLGIPVINNVSGLGTAFIRQGLLTKIVSTLYRVAFRRSSKVFFQNPEDRDLFVSSETVRARQSALLPGSGIDLVRFSPAEAERRPGEFRFLLIARLLWDKGIREYVEAARLVRAEHPESSFQILGFLDVKNRTAVSRSDVEVWTAEGLIDYLGTADDVRPSIADADCVVLPSYREGLPRTLLEASAMGKPLIATDVPGCRQVLVDGVNGFQCQPRDAESLAEAMLQMMRLSPPDRLRMGRAARARAESKFDERIITKLYLSAIEEALRQEDWPHRPRS